MADPYAHQSATCTTPRSSTSRSSCSTTTTTTPTSIPRRPTGRWPAGRCASRRSPPTCAAAAAEMLAKQINQGALDTQFGAGDKEMFLAYLRREGYLTAKDVQVHRRRGPRLRGRSGRGPGSRPGRRDQALRDAGRAAFDRLARTDLGLRLRPAAHHVPARGRHGPHPGRLRAQHQAGIIRCSTKVEKIAQDANLGDRLLCRRQGAARHGDRRLRHGLHPAVGAAQHRHAGLAQVQGSHRRRAPTPWSARSACR